jgi:hypothetical protein
MWSGAPDQTDQTLFCTTGNDRVYITAHVGDISTLSLFLDYDLGSVNGGRRFRDRPRYLVH